MHWPLLLASGQSSEVTSSSLNPEWKAGGGKSQPPLVSVSELIFQIHPLSGQRSAVSQLPILPHATPLSPHTPGSQWLY